jgi:hypothetical protein
MGFGLALYVRPVPDRKVDHEREVSDCEFADKGPEDVGG